MPIGIILNTEQLDNIEFEVGEIEHHLHNYERWFGISADQSGDNWALETGLTPYIVTSGDAVFGVAIKLLGPDDTPEQSGKTVFDLHRILVSDLSVNTIYYLRIIEDVDGDNDADIAEGKGYYTDTPAITVDTNTNRAGGFPVDVLDKRLMDGLRAWAKVKNVTNNSTFSFYIGIHEYDE